MGASHVSERGRGRCAVRAILPIAAAAGALGPAAAESPAQLVFSERSAVAGVVANHSPAFLLVISQYNVSSMTSGGAVGDFNNDGFQDLFVLPTGGSPDKYFVNNGDGTFTEQASAAGLAQTHMGIGAAVGDYDADGWLDLYVTSFGPADQNPQPGKHFLYHNNGDGTFTDVAVQAGVNQTGPVAPDGFGAAFGDYDLDGDLDLFVAGWIYNSGGNRLFQNDGDGTFTDVTDAAGVTSNTVRGFAPRFVDMDGDRFPELLLAADFETSRYFVNNRDGTFTNYTEASGTGLDDNGMGQTIGDFDGDGLLDWYVTSIYSPNSQLLGVPGTGNMLYMNGGEHSYSETSVAAGVNDGGWGWGTVAVDFDHDGDVDLAETNGWPQYNMGQQEWLNEQSYLWRNTGGGVFLEHAVQCNFLHYLQGRGMLNFDYDNDGDQDIAIFAYFGPVKLYRNDLSACEMCPNINWLRVFLNAAPAIGLAPNGFGSRVFVTAGGQTQVRSINGGCNYLAQSELSAHFGLGPSLVIDELRVEWADGRVTRQFGVPVNQTLTISAPPGLGGDLDGDLDLDGLDFSLFLLAFGACVGAAEYDALADPDADGCVTEADYAIWLQQYQVFIADAAAGPPIPSDAGDMNADGVVSESDVRPFIRTIVYPEIAPFRDFFVADVNGDGSPNGADVQTFVGTLFSGA